MSTETERFVAAARSYCAFIEDSSEDLIDRRVHRAAILLADLYATALALPALEPGEAEPPDAPTPETWRSFGELDLYWEVFDPYVNDTPVCTTLSDDLLDVYRDIRCGLLLYDQRGPDAEASAVWHWRFHRQIHWGDHAVDALRALQRAINRTALE